MAGESVESCGAGWQTAALVGHSGVREVSRTSSDGASEGAAVQIAGWFSLRCRQALCGAPTTGDRRRGE